MTLRCPRCTSTNVWTGLKSNHLCRNCGLSWKATRMTEKQSAAVIDAAHIAHQREFSLATFGPGLRTDGVLDHIAKEAHEVRADPTDLGEWVDIIILAFDGAHRTGADPQAIIDAIKAKQARNEARTWPDWRTAEPGKAIEHDRTGEAAQRGGEAVDREALALHVPRYDAADEVYTCAGCPLRVDRWVKFAEHIALLAARGDAAPTEVEWGVRHDGGEIVATFPERDHAEEYADGIEGRLVQRTVFAWREVR